MNMLKKLTMMLFAFLWAHTLSAQDKTVTGTITSAEDGLPLLGATIVVKGESVGASADFDGNYSINVAEGKTLVFSYVGFRPKEIVVGASNSYDVVLQPDFAQLDEVVLTGYKEEKKSDIAGAITVVEVDNVAQESSPNILTALQGRVPGIQINSGGTPGGNDTQIVIRGLTTVNSSSSPLFVIDGVQTFNPAALNPDEIESIQVLKDGASAAIYGTSAANGVIVVTTKKGRAGVAELNVKLETTAQFLRDRIDLLNAQQWADVRYQSQLGAGITNPSHPVLINNGSGFSIPQFLDPNGVQTASDTDWVDVITGPSFLTTADVSYRKGGEKYNLFAGVNYVTDQGIQKFTEYQRFNARLNTSFKLLNDRITVGENLLVSNFFETKVNPNDRPNEFENAILQNPLIPVFTNNPGVDYAAPLGGGLQDKPNPLANLRSTRNNREYTFRTLGNVYTDIKILDGLVFSTKLNFDWSNFVFNSRNEPFSVNGAVPSIFENFTVERNTGDFLNTVWTNLLNYDKAFGKHRISALAGYEQTKQEEESNLIRTIGVDITGDEPLVRDDAEIQEIPTLIEYRKLSQFGSLKYIFDDKYILSGTIRRDGSSRFGSSNRFAIFPAASVAWNVDREGFLQNSEIISSLKFRGSWGINGNDLIGDYLFFSRFVGSDRAPEFTNFDIDGDGTGVSEGVVLDIQANPDIQWEETTQTNVGFDLGLLNNRIRLSGDFFRKETDNLILQPIPISILGEADAAFINAGLVSNEGFEGVLSYNSKPGGDFNYGIDLNFATYDNLVESLDTDANFIIPNGISITRAGDPIASFFGFQADGLFRTPEEVAVHAEQPGKGLGRIRYRDINGDGIINSEDRTIIGNPHPDFIYGINTFANYKNWDLTLYFDGKHGNDLYNTQRQLLDFPFFGFNHGTNTLDAWAPDNANSNIPALSTQNVNDELRPSSYFVEDGSYLRLKTITLGYSFSQRNLEQIGFKGLRLYLVGQNLFTITSFTGFDYEVSGLSSGGIGIAGYGIPHTKSLTFGLNATF